MFCLVFSLNHPKTFRNTLIIVTPFLSFDGISHGYLVTISITHNKNLILSLNSVKSAPEIFSLIEE